MTHLNPDAPHGVSDPSITIRTIRIRREVLAALRLLGRGRILETKDLGRVARSALVGPDFEDALEPKDGEIANCARHFAFIRSGDEMLLTWRNKEGGKPAAFWLDPESALEDVDEVLAAYDRRLIAHALSKKVSSGPRTRIIDNETRGILHFEESPAPEPVRDSVAAGTCYERDRKPLAGALVDGHEYPVTEPPEDRGWASAPCARTEIERLEERRIGERNVEIDTSHSPAKVEEFLERFRDWAERMQRSDVLTTLSEFVAVPMGGPISEPYLSRYSEFARQFSNLSPWEKNNVLFRLTDLAARLLVERARDWARFVDPGRKPRKKDDDA